MRTLLELNYEFLLSVLGKITNTHKQMQRSAESVKSLINEFFYVFRMVNESVFSRMNMNSHSLFFCYTEAALMSLPTMTSA